MKAKFGGGVTVLPEDETPKLRAFILRHAKGSLLNAITSRDRRYAFQIFCFYEQILRTSAAEPSSQQKAAYELQIERIRLSVA